MAVTKRTCFEVFRRDQFTCQYCGVKAPDAELRPDHVVPKALGGDDRPSNLVTACVDCNSGKSSIAPDSPLVSGLSDKATAYALGMIDKMTRFRADVEAIDDYAEQFLSFWDGGWTADGSRLPLPPDYRMSLYRWMRMGVPIRAFELAVPAAMSRPTLGASAVFTYMAGIVWKMVDEREIDYSVTDETCAVYTQMEYEDYGIQSYEIGRYSTTKTPLHAIELERAAVHYAELAGVLDAP